MRDPKPYSRGELNSEFWRWLRERPRLIAQIAGLFVGLISLQAAALWLTLRHHQSGWFVAGVVLGATVVAMCWVLNLVFLANNARAVHQLRGAWGEDFTRDELKRAKRKRLVWDSVHSIGTKHGDVDHFVVTRRAGLVVIDSKFRTAVDAPDRDAVLASARRVEKMAEALTTSVLDPSRGRHRGRLKIDVRPVVVLWGPGSRAVTEPTDAEGVTVVAGRDLVRWLAQQEREPIVRDVARDLIDRLCEWRDKQRRLAAQSR